MNLARAVRISGDGGQEGKHLAKIQKNGSGAFGLVGGALRGDARTEGESTCRGGTRTHIIGCVTNSAVYFRMLNVVELPKTTIKYNS